MSKWIVIAGLVLLVLAAVVLTHRNRSRLAVATPLELPFQFLAVKPNVPQYKPNRDLAKTLKYDAAYAVASAENTFQGKKNTWSSAKGTPLITALGCYEDFAGQPVFVEADIRGMKVEAFNFSALTISGLLRDFEDAMKTNQIAFVRDRTNAVWVIRATNESTFRRKLGLP